MSAFAIEPAITAASPAAVELRDASKWYGEVIGVNQVTLRFEKGITGLLGPNGAGKSTLLKLITGQLRPGRGQVRVFGRDPWSDRATFRQVGYCPDAENLYEEFSAREFLVLMANLSGFGARDARRRSDTCLELVNLAKDMHRRIRGFSKGMRQRTKLAAALLHDPDLLVLDEPLNGLDPSGRLEMLELFRQLGAEGKSLVVSSHILHEVEALNPRVALMARGRLIAEGKVEEIRALIDSRPLTLRVETTAPRDIATILAGLESTVSLEIAGGVARGPNGVGAGMSAHRRARQSVTVRTSRPDDVCEAIQSAVIARQIPVSSLTALDENLEAVFSYLTD